MMRGDFHRNLASLGFK